MPRKKMSFIRFTRFATARKVMERAWASDSLYPAPSWKRTAARFGWKTTLKAAPSFLFYYLARLRRMTHSPPRRGGEARQPPRSASPIGRSLNKRPATVSAELQLRLRPIGLAHRALLCEEGNFSSISPAKARTRCSSRWHEQLPNPTLEGGSPREAFC